MMILDCKPEPNATKDICTVGGTRAGECRESLSHLSHRTKFISICSPKCMEAFQRDPDRFATDDAPGPPIP